MGGFVLLREAQGGLCGVRVTLISLQHHLLLVLVHCPGNKQVCTGQLCCGAAEVVDVPLSIASQGLLHREKGGISPLIQKLRLLW